MPRHTFTLDQEAEIVARYQDGTGLPTLMKIYGCSDKPLLRVLRLHGAYEPGRRFQGRYTGEQRQEMARRYEAGESLKQIARAFGCTAVNVKWTVERRGVKMRRPGPAEVDPEILAVVKQRREAGLNSREIGDELGLPAHRIVWYFDLLGLPKTRAVGRHHSAWKGGRHFHRGYWEIYVERDDPLRVMAKQNNYIPEHRLVMARSLGRPLTSDETVHHINGEKTDNRLENLQLRNGNHGKGAKFTCLDCGSHNVRAGAL